LTTTEKKNEVLVLSNGVSNIPFINDELNHYLNNIQAKKLIIFDSCHSDTVNRGDTKSVKAKTLPTNQLNRVVGKGLKVGADIERGEYLVLSASQDDEQSSIFISIVAKNNIFLKVKLPIYS
jgi:hypothetical protein